MIVLYSENYKVVALADSDSGCWLAAAAGRPRRCRCAREPQAYRGAPPHSSARRYRRVRGPGGGATHTLASARTFPHRAAALMAPQVELAAVRQSSLRYTLYAYMHLYSDDTPRRSCAVAEAPGSLFTSG
jgi:hypothetical protein